jgi:hypothetical protein
VNLDYELLRLYLKSVFGVNKYVLKVNKRICFFFSPFFTVTPLFLPICESAHFVMYMSKMNVGIHRSIQKEIPAPENTKYMFM